MPTCLLSITDFKRIHEPGAFVHSFKDDFRFDGRSGVWRNTEKFCRELLIRRMGALTPDFSTPRELPEIMCWFNLFRSRLVGVELETWNIPVIPTLMWWNEEMLEKSLIGLPEQSIYAVSTVCVMKSPKDKSIFQHCLLKACDKLKPSMLLVYGSVRGLDFGGQKIKVLPNGTYNWSHLTNNKESEV